MKRLIPLILLLLAGNAVAVQTYLCDADIANGARAYQNGNWATTQFTASQQWIIKMDGDNGVWYQHGSAASKLGQDFLKKWNTCKRSKSGVECETVDASLTIYFHHDRFVYTRYWAYLVGQENDPSFDPGTYHDVYTAIGQCSKL